MSLKSALDAHAEILSRAGMGINSPLLRRLQEVIKTAYGREGVEAIRAVRAGASKIAGSQINALIRRGGQSDAALPEKRKGEARLQRQAGNQGENRPQRSTREQRNALRAAMQGISIQTHTTELEDAESVVEAKPTLSNIEGPLTPTDVSNLGQMSPREILETFGTARIDDTLQSIGASLNGSDRQRASRLKKLLIAE